MPERYALYYAPAVTSELWRRASIWLGADAATGGTFEADVGGLDPERRHKLTVSARRYGFHGTIKAPMALDAKLEGKDLDRAVKAWAEVNAPVVIGRLAVKSLGGFVALMPERPGLALTQFAGRVVKEFDDFRAPLSDAERAHRVAGGKLSPRQAELLERYGYQYVLEEFRFHMTLADQMADEELTEVLAAAQGWFEPALHDEIMLDRLVVFHEPQPGAPFRRLRDYPLKG